MTIWVPSIEHMSGPRYRAIAQAIGDAIASGALAPGEKLPPQRRLADALGVTVGTVTRGYAEAEQRGWVMASFCVAVSFCVALDTVQCTGTGILL